MKAITVLLVVLVAGTSSYLIKVPTVPTQPRIGPVGWVHLQKLILPLFENVCEDSVNPTIVRLAQEFTLDSTTTGLYSKPEVITNLQTLKTMGLLPKGEIFTDYNTNHLIELRTLFEVLFYAKDFDTFLKAASWARQNVNCGLYVRAIYLAVIKRRDTAKLSVPAPYELLPNYFIKKDVVIKASALLAGQDIDLDNNICNEGNSYVLDANYTANLMDNDEESKLAYFHEDVGLNTYYFLQKLKRSPWLTITADWGIRYGEYLYHMMKQLSARYSLERYANSLPDIMFNQLEGFDADPYDPELIYSNGNEFGHRTTLLHTENDELIRNIENRIASVVTHTMEPGSNKTHILNTLMDILVTEEGNFENILRTSIGKDESFTISQPSVLEHYMTSPRDPMFWRITKKIVDLVDDALKAVPVYARNELYFPGIEILNIDVKKISTNFDYFQFDVTDSLKTGGDNTAFQVKIGQQRLNHKPFAVKLNISSLVTQKGLIKIYLGPKAAPGELYLKKNSFMCLDSFEWNFKVGSNVISRSSVEMSNLSEDFPSIRTTRKNVEDAEFGLNSLPLKNIETFLGFPQRLILPKGTSDGLPLQIFVFVAPFVKSMYSDIYSIPNVEFNSAVLSPGYPLDLDITNSHLFDLPNALVKDVLVTHKGDKVKFDGKQNYEPSSQPEYAAFRKEPFDYTAKKSQYGAKERTFGKQEDFASKREYYKGKGDTKKYDHTTEPLKPGVLDGETDIKSNNVDDKPIDAVVIGSVDEPDHRNLISLYTRKPSVFDFIINTNGDSERETNEDYDHENDIDHKVYE